MICPPNEPTSSPRAACSIARVSPSRSQYSSLLRRACCTNFVARTLHEFSEGLRGVSVHCIHHHFIEALLRLKLMSNDFSQWLHEDLGLTEAARRLNRIDIYTATLDDVREQIIRIVERALI